MNAAHAARQAVAYASQALAAEDRGDTRDLLDDAAQARSAANLAAYLDPDHPATDLAERWTRLAEDAADPIRYKPKEPRT